MSRINKLKDMSAAMRIAVAALAATTSKTGLWNGTPRGKHATARKQRAEAKRNRKDR